MSANAITRQSEPTGRRIYVFANMPLKRAVAPSALQASEFGLRLSKEWRVRSALGKVVKCKTTSKQLSIPATQPVLYLDYAVYLQPELKGVFAHVRRTFAPFIGRAPAGDFEAIKEFSNMHVAHQSQTLNDSALA
jgi:hypothetical protein